ncbi:MAG: CBS domain-containing protein [Rhodospirillales bacterium]|nr:CBS domain-containing protein [Rhodospirillales bacterium]
MRAMASRTVKDIVADQDLLWIGPEASVLDAVTRMDGRNVAAVLVIENGALAGIFTERDLLKRVVAKALDPARTRISTAMTASPVTIPLDANALSAMRAMCRHSVRHLPVMDGTRIAGIVSLRDFVGREISEFEREREIQDQLWEG